MPPTLFIAVQCYQCSTMQVKQKKKSNNWTCVVCNQKQSARKVFSQSYMAKDVRKIVQSFNMSRKFTDEQSETLISPSDAGLSEDQQKKRRSDWNEYLDPIEDGNKENVVEEGDDFGPKIVTELPKELFKKPKLRNYPSDAGKTHDNSYKPVFSKGKPRHGSYPQGEEGMKHQALKVISPNVWCDFTTKGHEEPRTSQSQPAKKTKGSKWETYLTDDSNNLKERNSAEADIWETMVDDHKVEDDIHPDFM